MHWHHGCEGDYLMGSTNIHTRGFWSGSESIQMAREMVEIVDKAVCNDT